MATTATPGRSGPSSARMCGTGPVPTLTTGWSRTTGASKVATGPCGASNAPDQPPGSAALTMNCATSSALAPATTNTCPPTDADCSTSGGLRPCWPSCKPHDPGLASSQLRQYLLARALTEPVREHERALPEVGDQQRRKHEREPHNPDRPSAEMAHIGKERLSSREGEEARCHHPES